MYLAQTGLIFGVLCHLPRSPTNSACAASHVGPYDADSNRASRVSSIQEPRLSEKGTLVRCTQSLLVASPVTVLRSCFLCFVQVSRRFCFVDSVRAENYSNTFSVCLLGSTPLS